ncbi:MAG: DUF58 domain-containing protein [Eubacteriales bacterium]|nr:DUF58 domain-containing protein [Eubacteriales bacterium]
MVNNSFRLLILGLLLFFAVAIIGGVMPYFILYVFLLALLIPWTHSFIVLQSLTGRVNVPREAFYIGESVNIGYQIKNRSIFRIPFLELNSFISQRLSGKETPKEIITLESKQDFSKNETIVLKRRGFYELGDLEVSVNDVFRFFSLKKNITSNIGLIVYPKIIRLSTFEIMASQQLGELRVFDRAFLDKSRTTSLKPYQEGDSIKRVHWKMSAKKDEIIVKDYENRGDTHVAVFIDNDQKHFTRDVDRRLEDKIVDVAVCMVNYCLDQHVEVFLETQKGGDFIRIYGQEKSDMKPFLEAMALFKGNGEIDFRAYMKPRVETIRKGATVIIITSCLDKAMGAQGIQLKMSNLNPLFIVVMDRQNRNGWIDADIEKKLKQEGINLYAIDHNTSIKEAMEAQYG